MVTQAGQDVGSPLVDFVHHQDLFAILTEVVLIDLDGAYTLLSALAVPVSLTVDPSQCREADCWRAL